MDSKYREIDHQTTNGVGDHARSSPRTETARAATAAGQDNPAGPVDASGEISYTVSGGEMAMNVNDWERIVSLVLGFVGLFFLARGVLVYLVLAGTSAYLVFRGLTGHCYIYDKANLNTRAADLPSPQWTGSQVDARFDAEVEEEQDMRTRDEVEEASWESFPASDPPAFNR
ncbi:MAG: DUF2892 domain-containing protein [Caldilineaceae bacterium]|nr:DUF2892 domain-containing protein [Caldilineaceae bacterium]